MRATMLVALMAGGLLFVFDNDAAANDLTGGMGVAAFASSPDYSTYAPTATALAPVPSTPDVLGAPERGANSVRPDGDAAAAYGDTPCPRIPDASDLRLTADERRRVEAGEIIMQIVSDVEDERQVRAIGYLNADPVWLFDLATDSSLAPELLAAVKDVQILEQRPYGKLFRGVAKPAFFLPTYQYTLAAKYRPDGTGQCWGQVEGDFERNEGAHSFIWHPERRQTLAVFSFYFTLRGVLKLVPESWLLTNAGRTLPEFMHNLDALVPKYRERDDDRAHRNAVAWISLRRSLEAGELPGRVWTDVGSAPPLHAAR
jgi:hypothetical protein